MPEPDPSSEPTPSVEPGPEPLGPVTWREVMHDFLKPSRGQLVMALILLLCGLAVVMQIRAGSQTDYASMSRADLVQMLDDLNEESRKLDGELTTLEETRQQLQSGADRQQVARQEARRRLDVLSILGGTAPAQGAGVRIIINDPAGKVTPEILLNALEEMRDAGAEVIEINDSIRVVGSSWVGTAASGLVVDDLPVTRPIVLDIIGEPHALTEAARFRGGLVSEVEDERVGGSVTILSEQQVVVSTVRSPRPAQYARPA